MKAEIHVSTTVQETLEKVCSALQDDRFIFSEEDAKFVVEYSDKTCVKTKNFSRFWSRRDLGDKYPAHFSLVIEGTMESEEGGTVINLDIVEYHHSREHTYGGTRAIGEYFDKFCEIFEK
jgi:hypothetical protein